MHESTTKIIGELIRRYPPLDVCAADIRAAIESLTACFQKGCKLLACGNGGSAADCEHVVGELMKAFVLPRHIAAEDRELLEKLYPEDAGYMVKNLQRALPAISLVSQVGLMTAFGNDLSADMVFAQQVLSYGQPGDILLAISTSGNSPNVLYAAKAARLRDIKVLGLTGENGGKLKALCDVCICAPSPVTYRIQEYHLPIYHTLCLCVENEFWGENI